ncbi:M23 family metallopeptidase [Sphingomonas sp. BN140010]|uniref:M23 family metallopeptidase n=1 Tax=Sphingomonas arvum TaxID=2992113 RepID=A0ABT3JE17_9SPHN|nr:M23 family metallopeptidase [Sphingomonas sp. BN140010]MCW3797316.1 M23 family metallopeptidase [Sphingomonas sp. BN140010]
MAVSKLSLVGNTLVLVIVVGGGWLVWNNASKSPDQPPPAVGALSDAAQKIGYDPARNAPRSAALRTGALAISPAGLALPVDGIQPSDLTDTYTQSRAGGARVHNAIDIMAPRGRPVISATPGTVEKLFYSKGGGGITAYVRSPDRQWLYYYAHLDAYAPGLREGQQVTRGTPIGTVGFTGNANPSGPHLHFAVYRMGPNEKWYQGQPINPYPLLAGKRAGG